MDKELTIEQRYQALTEKKMRMEGELQSKEQERGRLLDRRNAILVELKEMGINSEDELNARIQSLTDELGAAVSTVEQKFKEAGI